MRKFDKQESGIYILSRTSDSSAKPIENAFKALAKRNYKTINGLDTGYADVWMAQVSDLSEFVDRFGDVVLQKWFYNKDFLEIEIYDSYRE